MSEPITETINGDGFAASSLDSIGQGPGFRKVRKELDVKEMGVNAIVMPPGIASGTHWHDRQEEVYFVHSGQLTFTLGENDEQEVTLGPGGVIRVDAQTQRSTRNEGTEDAVYIVFGAHGGYVGRDGQARQDENRVSPITS